MRYFKLSIFVTVLVGLLSCGSGGGSEAGNKSSENSSTNRYVTAEDYVNSQQFVGTMLISKYGVDILRKGFGYSDASRQLQNGVETRYRIGSMTKAFTALAVVQLKNAGVISNYDDPVSSYIPNYPRGQEISIRHLLTHRSGIPEYIPYINFNISYTSSEMINVFKYLPLEFSPGQGWVYSNSNYILLGFLIETLSGIGYERYLHDNIFGPFGLVNTEYGSSTITGSEYAKGYQDSLQTLDADFVDMSIPHSAGALSSNIEDLENWAGEILLVAEENPEIFVETVTGTSPGSGYGFGWMTRIYGGKTAYTHVGEIRGFSSMIAIFPEENGLIIMLSNIEGSTQKLREMADILATHEL